MSGEGEGGSVGSWKVLMMTLQEIVDNWLTCQV